MRSDGRFREHAYVVATSVALGVGIAAATGDLPHLSLTPKPAARPSADRSPTGRVIELAAPAVNVEPRDEPTVSTSGAAATVVVQAAPVEPRPIAAVRSQPPPVAAPPSEPPAPQAAPEPQPAPAAPAEPQPDPQPQPDSPLPDLPLPDLPIGTMTL